MDLVEIKLLDTMHSIHQRRFHQLVTTPPRCDTPEWSYFINNIVFLRVAEVFTEPSDAYQSRHERNTNWHRG